MQSSLLFQKVKIDSAGRGVGELSIFGAEVENLDALRVPDGSVHEFKTCGAKSRSVNGGSNSCFSDVKSGLEEAEKVGGVVGANIACNILVPGHVHHVFPDGGESEILVHLKEIVQAIADGKGLNHEHCADDDQCESCNSHLYGFNFNNYNNLLPT